MAAKTPISTQQKDGNWGCLILFGIPFAGFGLLFLWLSTIGPQLALARSSDWRPIPCEILRSEIKQDRDSDGNPTWSNDIAYRYTFQGKTYDGDAIDFAGSSGGKERTTNIKNQFPAGFETDCFVDPNAPENSVLLREAKLSIFGMLFSILFATIGFAVSTFGYIALRNSKKPSAASGPAAITNRIVVDPRMPSNQLQRDFDSPRVDHKSDVADRESNRPQRLKPDSSALIRLVGATFVCLFWNGIVSVFVYHLFTDNFSYFMALFLVPFVLIGIMLIGGVFYCLLSLFNPKTEIALSTGTVPLGGEVDLAWELKGRTASIRQLTIDVVGIESATYTRGTDTITDTEEFETISVINSDDAHEFAFGSCTLTLPENTMHTFEGDNNKITWKIRVCGDIPWWPDVKEEFAFRVSPSRVEERVKD